MEPLTDFLSETDHNMMLFANQESRRHVRKLANNLGVDFESYGSTVRDNTQVDPSTVASKNIFAPLTEHSIPVFDKFDSSSHGVKFSGIGSYIDP